MKFEAEEAKLSPEFIEFITCINASKFEICSTLINIICIVIEHSQLFPRDNVRHIVLFDSSQINSSSSRLNPSCPFNVLPSFHLLNDTFIECTDRQLWLSSKLNSSHPKLLLPYLIPHIAIARKDSCLTRSNRWHVDSYWTRSISKKIIISSVIVF